MSEAKEALVERSDALSNETRTRERRRRLVNAPGARCLFGVDEDESMGFEKEDRQAFENDADTSSTSQQSTRN